VICVTMTLLENTYSITASYSNYVFACARVEDKFPLTYYLCSDDSGRCYYIPLIMDQSSIGQRCYIRCT